MRRSNSLFYLILFILTVGIAGQATAGRYYDPAYGRWTTFDPALNEKSPQKLLELQNGKLFTQSPYNYSYNNPLRFIDPDGKVPILPILWAAAEAGFAAFDLYQLYQVYNDPNATDQERAEQYYATMSGLIGPGGGYKQIKEEAVSLFNRIIKGEKSLKEIANSTNWGNVKTLERHFKDHGKDFDTESVESYAQKASDFLKRIGDEGMEYKVYNDGTIRVYDKSTNTFGAFNPDGTTKTFFKPKRGEEYWKDQLKRK